MAKSVFCKRKVSSVGLSQGQDQGCRVLASLCDYLLIPSNVTAFSDQAHIFHLHWSDWVDGNLLLLSNFLICPCIEFPKWRVILNRNQQMSQKLNPHLPMTCKHFTYYKSFHKWLLSCFYSLQTVTEKFSLKTLSLANFTLSHLPSSFSAQ